jgi:glyoxylase-like metal-dependent hydrolase (beta-lactamase superfamily II)
MKMLFALFILSALSPVSAHAAEEYAPLSKSLQMGEVPGKQIYFSIGSPGVPGKVNEGNTSNAGFVVTSDGVVVFDALGTPSLGAALVKEIRKVTDKPVRYIVVSHYHADHIYGLQAVKEQFPDCIIVAQDHASEYQENAETSDERAEIRLDQRRGALFPWVNDRTRVVQPDMTFSDKASITLGGKRFLLLYAGPAHSASDVMMMMQPDGVLFAGDIVQNGRVPFMNSDDVDTKRWLMSLQEVESLRPGFIIPGHGQPSTQAKEAIAFTSSYIRYVREVMEKAVADWIDFDTAYAQADWSRYAKLPAFDANNKGNAYRVYLELEGSRFATDTAGPEQKN